MARVYDRSILLALIVSTGPILVLCHGILGVGPAFTGVFMAGTTIALFALSRWSDFNLYPADALFAAFLCAAAISFMENGSADWKETMLFVLSVSAYPAARLYSTGEVKPAFIWITAAIVLVGMIATVPALIDQWNYPHGKPYVLGRFDSAPIQFLTSLGFLIIALSCTPLTARKTAIIAALISIPIAVFAAAMVRFTFVAIAGSLIVALIFAMPKDRKLIGALGLVVLVAMASGQIARHFTATKLMDAEIDSIAARITPPAVYAAAGSDILIPETPACPIVDLDSSIAIRKELLRETWNMLPSVGLFGIGLNGFTETACIRNTEIHNSVLQAFVEFGWIGGGAIILLILGSAAFLFPLARNDLEVRFVLCSLVYLTALSLAYGRISRDTLLFLFLGYAVNLHGRLLGASGEEGAENGYHLIPAGRRY